jgi:hypothetical protein
VAADLDLDRHIVRPFFSSPSRAPWQAPGDIRWRAAPKQRRLRRTGVGTSCSRICRLPADPSAVCHSRHWREKGPWRSPPATVGCCAYIIFLLIADRGASNFYVTRSTSSAILGGAMSRTVSVEDTWARECDRVARLVLSVPSASSVCVNWRTRSGDYSDTRRPAIGGRSDAVGRTSGGDASAFWRGAGASATDARRTRGALSYDSNRHIPVVRSLSSDRLGGWLSRAR